MESLGYQGFACPAQHNRSRLRHGIKISPAGVIRNHFPRPPRRCRGACSFVAGLTLAYRFFPPVSTLMLARWLEGETVDRQYVPIERISEILRADVIVSEDARFCTHDGVDWGALREVMNRRGGPSRGASTIPMQTAKNLFSGRPAPTSARASKFPWHCCSTSRGRNGAFSRSISTWPNGAMASLAPSGGPPLFPQERRAAGRPGGRLAGNRPPQSEAPQSGKALPASCGARGPHYGARSA